MTHYDAFHAAVAERELPKPRPRYWCPAPISCVSFDRAWLAIHGTLPRTINDDGSAHKPRGAADGAAMLRSIAESGAVGVSALLVGVEYETFCAGAAQLGWSFEVQPGVQSAEFEPRDLGTCVHLEFPPIPPSAAEREP